MIKIVNYKLECEINIEENDHIQITPDFSDPDDLKIRLEFKYFDIFYSKDEALLLFRKSFFKQNRWYIICLCDIFLLDLKNIKNKFIHSIHNYNARTDLYIHIHRLTDIQKRKIKLKEINF
jgi:hypothetical protein